MRNFRYLATTIGLGLLAGAALAQAPPTGPGWFLECIDPDKDGNPFTAYSDDYNILALGNDLIKVALGTSGKVDFGGDRNDDKISVCYSDTRSLEAAGRLCFSVGPLGSVQSAFDNDLALTTGAPMDPVGDFCYARILKGDNNTSVLYGDGGMQGFWTGLSKRYMIGVWSDADVSAELEVRVIADAVRLRWRLTNLKATPQPLGLMWGAYVGMFGSTKDSVGANEANTRLQGWTGTRRVYDTFLSFPDMDYIGWTTLPTGKPVRNWRRYASSSPTFPAYVDFQFAQAQPYGTRVENGPTEATKDASMADLIVLGSHTGLLGGNAMYPHVFGDPNDTKEEADVAINDMSFIQRFPVQTVAAGAYRDVVHYVRQPWSSASYLDPYSVVVDAPRVIAPNRSGDPGFQQSEYTVRAYVDNQYAVLDKEVAQQNVKLTITLPPGVDLASGEAATKTIGRVEPNAIASVDWKVVPQVTAHGKLPFIVSVNAVPGPAKTVTAYTEVAPTRVLRLSAGPNLVTFPYRFADSSLDAILGLQAGVDYLAYRWNPEQYTYVPTTTVERGAAYWVVPATDQGYVTLQNASEATDTAKGGTLFSLSQGWNLIGNPYNYPVPLAQLVGVAEESPAESMTWIELVQAGYVTSSLAFYDTDSRQYRYTSGPDALLEPHVGYWIYAASYKPVRISWPGVYVPGYPNASRSGADTFQQTAKQWRLQLVARNGDGIDSQNFVGLAKDAKAANALRSPKPPMAPQAKVELSISDEYNGKAVRAAAAFTDKLARKEWKVNVRSEQAGDVTVTWPNLASLPRNIRLKLADPATGVTKDLRVVSGYTFNMNAAGTRELTLTMEPSGSAKPVIGNVVVTRPSRDRNAAFSINYALSADALVTVRVLSGAGREVYTVTRGRADNAGQNAVTWAMRDNANRSVAPGVYRVEILAETPSGERVRKVVPVNVVR